MPPPRSASSGVSIYPPVDGWARDNAISSLRPPAPIGAGTVLASIDQAAMRQGPGPPGSVSGFGRVLSLARPPCSHPQRRHAAKIDWHDWLEWSGHVWTERNRPTAALRWDWSPSRQ